MKKISLSLIAALLVLGVSCNRDPKVVAQRYVQNGNRYFDAGKYKEASIMYRKAIAKNKLSADAWYRLSQAETRLGRFSPEGFNALQYAVSLSPDNPKAQLQLGEAYLVGYLSASKKEVWAAELDSLIDKKVKDNVVKLRLQGTRALYIKKDFKAAIAAYEAANAAAPFTPEIVFPLAQVLILDNRGAEAEKVAKATIERNGNFEPLYDVLYGYYMKANRVGDAESILKAKAANNPKSATALLGLARFYRGAKRTAEMNRMLDRLVSDTADFPDGRLIAGEAFVREGDYATAIGYLEPGVRSDPKRRTEYQKWIARALVSQNKKKEAAAILAEVVKEKPDDVEASALNAELLIDSDPGKAAEQLKDTVNRLPTDARARLNLARALMARRPPDLDQARVNLEEALRLTPASVPAKLGLAEVLLAKREYAGAISSTTEILAAQPQNTAAKMMRSVAYAQTGNYAQARIDLVAVLKENPQSRDAALQLGALDIVEKKYAEAEELFTKLLQASPHDTRCVLSLAQVYALEPRYDKAIQLLQAELGKNPAQENTLLLTLGGIAGQARNYELAISTLKRLTGKTPESPEAWFQLGRVYRVKGDYNAAIENLRKASQLQPANTEIAVDLAVAFESVGKKQEARDIYEQVLKTQPDHFVVLNNLAYTLAETGGDLDRALMLAQRARQRQPRNADVADTLGWIYIRKELSDPAIEIYRDLVVRQSANPVFHYHLAMALYQKGDKLQAKKELQTALQRKPSKEDEGKIRSLMAKIG